jgi:DNA-binding Lrp family transcriptional regulator
MTETTRSKSIPSQELVEKFIPLVKEGKSYKEIATEIGMPEASLRTRISTLRTETLVATSVFTVDKKAVSGEALVATRLDELNAVVDGTNAAKKEGEADKPYKNFADAARSIKGDVADGKIKVKTEGVTLPTPQGSKVGRKRDMSALGARITALMAGDAD